MSKDPNQLFEDGFADICLAVFRLQKQGKYQEAYDGLGHIIDMLSADRHQMRVMHKDRLNV